MADFLDDLNDGDQEEATVPLGERLLEKRALSDDQLRIALYEQQSSQEPLGRVLVRLGFVTEATIRDILSESGGVSVVDLRKITVDPEVLASHTKINNTPIQSKTNTPILRKTRFRYIHLRNYF